MNVVVPSLVGWVIGPDAFSSVLPVAEVALSSPSLDEVPPQRLWGITGCCVHPDSPRIAAVAAVTIRATAPRRRLTAFPGAVCRGRESGWAQGQEQVPVRGPPREQRPSWSQSASWSR